MKVCISVISMMKISRRDILIFKSWIEIKLLVL